MSAPMPIGGQLNRQQDMMPNQMLMQQQQNLMEQQRQQYQRQLSLGTNHILCNHIFRLPLKVSIYLVLK